MLFPGVKQFGESQKLKEEWYALKNFAKDLHVILIEDNEGQIFVAGRVVPRVNTITGFINRGHRYVDRSRWPQ